MAAAVVALLLAATGAEGFSSSAAAQPQQQQQQQVGERINLEGVKNARDLASVKGSGIAPSRVIRSGFWSGATVEDRMNLKLKTLIDLRSNKELSEDANIANAPIYEGFVDVKLGTLSAGKEKKRSRRKEKEDGPSDPEAMAAVAGSSREVSPTEPTDEYRRYFVSLMDESIYKRGVFKRLKKRHKAKALGLLGLGKFSTRMYAKAVDLFIGKINDGGLLLLNELLIENSGENICEVLKILADPVHHPVAVYCTAGKDRTGIIVALTLVALGVGEEAILDDYILSNDAYEALDDRKAMVMALEQYKLDEEFLSAPRYVMEQTLAFIGNKYGSIEQYLDGIGFGPEWRKKLREALLADPGAKTPPPSPVP